LPRAWPPLAVYYKTAQIASVVLLVSGIYFEGGYSAEMQWRERVAEMEAKVAKAEEESKEANVKLDKKSAEKVKVIKGREIVVRQFVDREVAKYNDKCDIPKAFVDAHNMSAEQPK
jgi:translation elongation factor EF-Tu-like GTPase